MKIRRCARCDAVLDRPGSLSGTATSMDGAATYDACEACLRLLRVCLSETLKSFFARYA